MGQLFNNDATIFRKFFKEQARLLGIHVQYKYPVEMDFEITGQENPLGYSEPIEMDIIFDASPKLTTLKKLGWVSEDPQDKPYLVQLPFDAPNLQKGCLLYLPAMLPTMESRVFKITEIQADQIFPDSWYCKVAPKFDTQNTLKPSDYKEKPYSYLDMSDLDEIRN